MVEEQNIVKMKPPAGLGKLAGFGILAVLVLFLGLNSFVTVEAGHRGVLLQMGAVQPTVFNEGFHLKIPFIQEVIPVEVRVQKTESSAVSASKDLQSVSTTIAVNYHLDPLAVNKLYQQVGLSYADRIVNPAIAEALKAVTAQYTAEQLITKRQDVSNQVKENLGKKLSEYGMVLDEINITEFNFSDEFNKAIEQKQVAEQQALKARLDLERVKIEKEQTIQQAQATAEALRLQKQEVTPELVQLREIEAKLEAIRKWDGKLPQTTGGAVPFIDVSK